MRARLGPQEPGRSRPPVATTRAPRPDPMIAPMVQNVPPHRDPMVTPAMRNVHSHLGKRPAGRNLPNEPPIGSISKRLDDMLSTPFCSHITHYEPPRGFLVPKFSTYDGDQRSLRSHHALSTAYDARYCNDALLCKVFLPAFKGRPSHGFIAYLLTLLTISGTSLKHSWDSTYALLDTSRISAPSQNIKMKDNESLREFVKRFGQAVLQIEVCSMDAVLQIFKRSICPGTPFFESLAKKTSYNDGRFVQTANKYSMLEDDVRAATQQVLVAGRASRDNADRHAKPPDRPKPVDRSRTGRVTPRNGPIIRDRSKKCAFHKDHGHTTETCRSLQYLVERLIKAGHLKQYLRSDTGGRDASQHHNSGAPRAPVAPKAVINYINGGPSDEEYDSRRKRQKLLRAASIRERINSIRPGSSADLVQASVIGHMGHSLAGLENPGRILSGFNGSSTTSLGDIILPVRAGPVTLNVQFSVVQELSPFNVILGRTWLHYMKAIPSTYHQMVSFLTNEGQTDLYGSQLAARQCYQIAREAVANQEDASPPEPSIAHDQ
ncbi:hypothetical protein CK203_056143 [Vitis vinifera]|uniref:Retrotransposon gag domain-containing protein n=1 Tax=Vitis vinifera TaxID=29760 RepID=A0A438GE74_VITVI|nr:hypothetical protein CK203_056143 [Vitis vinifera]